MNNGKVSVVNVCLTIASLIYTAFITAMAVSLTKMSYYGNFNVALELKIDDIQVAVDGDYGFFEFQEGEMILKHAGILEERILTENGYYSHIYWGVVPLASSEASFDGTIKCWIVNVDDDPSKLFPPFQYEGVPVHAEMVPLFRKLIDQILANNTYLHEYGVPPLLVNTNPYKKRFMYAWIFYNSTWGICGVFFILVALLVISGKQFTNKNRKLRKKFEKRKQQTQEPLILI